MTTSRHRFTLLELLVAAIGSAVLMAALLVVLNAAWRMQRSTESRETASHARYTAQQQLQRDLAATVAPVGLLRGVFLATVDETGGGRHDTLEFVAAVGTTNPAMTGGDLVALRYELLESESSGVWALVRTESRYQLAVDVEEAEIARTILPDVASFSTEFYDGTDWVDGWDAAAQDNALPVTARLRLEFPAGVDGVAPAPIVVVASFYEAARETPTVVTAEVTR